MTQTQLRQSERPAGRRPDHLGARPRDPRARHHQGPAGIRIFRAHPLDPVRHADHPEFQPADRALSRRRRFQDRLHLRLRLQSRGVRHARRKAADRRRARRLLRHHARGARRATARSRLCLQQRSRPGSGPRSAPSTSLPPIDASPPNLRDEVCGGKHHRPASDEDDALIASTAGGSVGIGRRRDGANGRCSSPPACSRRCRSRRNGSPPVPAPSEPIVVYTGPTRSGAALVAAVAADSASQRRHRPARQARRASPRSPTPRPSRGRSRRGQAGKPRQADASAKPRGAAEARAARRRCRSRRQGRPPSRSAATASRAG